MWWTARHVMMAVMLSSRVKMNLLSPHVANLLAKSNILIGTVGCGYYLISDIPCQRERMRGYPLAEISFFPPTLLLQHHHHSSLGPHKMSAFPALNTHHIGLPIMAALLSYMSDICSQGSNLMHSTPWVRYGYVRKMVDSTTREHAFDLRTSFCFQRQEHASSTQRRGCGCLAGIIGDIRRYKTRWLLE